MNFTLVGKLIRLPRGDWAELFAAQAALCRAQLSVWTKRRGSLLAPVADRGESSEPGADLDAARRIALAISRVAEHSPFRPSCLVRALALHRMLESRGIRGSSLRVGVRREGAAFLAHAWVEYGGIVLADEAWRVRKFDELGPLGTEPS